MIWEVKLILPIKPIMFSVPLEEGVIVERKNRFDMLIALNGQTIECHCPTTWNIGQLNVAGRPCLLSRREKPDPRKTPYTVEAVSLNEPEEPNKKWIGINQTAANRYVEYFLKNDGFPDILPSSSRVRRARLSGKSNLDFIVGEACIAIKMPLLVLPDIPEHMRIGSKPSSPNTERFLKRITKLAHSLPDIKRTLLLVIYIHDHPEFHIGEFRELYQDYYPAIKDIAARSAEMGIENWQVNFSLNSTSVSLDRYFPLHTDE